MSAEQSQNNAALQRWYAARQKTKTSPSPGPMMGSSTAGMRIAIQGEPGSFSHEAAVKLVPDAQIVPRSLSAEVFETLSTGVVDAAVIPIENSLAGSVLEHFDLLLQYDVTVQGEMLLRIRHNLIALPGSRIEDIERVFSHPVALAQCRKFLADHPRMEAFAFYDTAGSVKHLVELQDRQAAGIASQSAAAFYGAQVLQVDIEDNSENYTRFFLVRRAHDAVHDANANKMSLAFSLENRPGSLVAALLELSNLGTNLTKIESRPVHGKPWEYIFYVDCQIETPEQGRRGIDALRKHCAMLKLLGSYTGTRE
jgi:prephenate dehydratase